MNSDEKLHEIKLILQEWIDKQSHERCWYYPDLFNKIAQTLDIKPTKNPSLPPINEFKKGCEKYQKEEYSKISHQ